MGKTAQFGTNLIYRKMKSCGKSQWKNINERPPAFVLYIHVRSRHFLFFCSFVPYINWLLHVQSERMPAIGWVNIVLFIILLLFIIGIVSALDAFRFARSSNVILCTTAALFAGIAWFFVFFETGSHFISEWGDVDFFGFPISLKDAALSGYFSAFVFFIVELYRIIRRPNALLSVRMSSPNAVWVDS